MTRAADSISSAHTFTVEALVAEVLAGRLRIPAFHRPLKWQQRDVLKLLDSIYRAYPIGTLLLWQRSAEAEHLVFGSITIDAPARTDALWIVDGQQRLLALTRALAGSGDHSESFSTYFDLHTQQFIRPPHEPAAHQMPLNVALDANRLLEWLHASSLSANDRAVALRLGKRLREFQVPAYIVETNDENTIREIFLRTNTTGKALDAADVFTELHFAGPSPTSLREVATQLASPQFGALDEGTLLKMLLANRGTDLSKDRVPELTPEQAREALSELGRSARATLSFLAQDAQIPHLSLLPHQHALFAISRFFARHPDAHPRSRELLARWLWRGALTGAHNGGTVNPREMLAAIDGDEHRSVQALLEGLPPDPGAPEVLDDFAFSHARSKIEVLALLALRPLDLRTGLPVLTEPEEEPSASEEPEEPPAANPDDRIKCLVRTIIPRSFGASSSVANRMVHPGVRSGLIHAILTCEDPLRLASHMISSAAVRALRGGDERSFLILRYDDLLQNLQTFITRRAAWDEPDFPPVEALRVGNL